MNRRKATLITLVGALIGIPAVALAASFIFATVTGETAFGDSKASVVILAATGTTTDNLDCTKTSGKGDSFTINPVGKRLTVGGKTTVQPGTCTITVKLQNDGDTAVAGPKADIKFPAGWKVDTGAGRAIPGGAEGVLTINVSSTETAEAGKITGSLTSDTDSGSKTETKTETTDS